MKNYDKVVDQVIMEGAEKQRQHELDMAKISQERAATQLREDRYHKDARRTWMGFFWLGAGILVAVLAIILAIVHGTSEDRKNQERERIRNIEVAETCIREGNIWLNGNCLIANKPVQ